MAGSSRDGVGWHGRGRLVRFGAKAVVNNSPVVLVVEASPDVADPVRANLSVRDFTVVVSQVRDGLLGQILLSRSTSSSSISCRPGAEDFDLCRDIPADEVVVMEVELHCNKHSLPTMCFS
jgi:hypothetical protein